ncbi:MAG: FmdB family zinc ribbon protein [Phycisphaerae bacterium]
MPMLEFHCPNCDAIFEELVRSADNKASVACPTCRSRQVERRISVFSAHASSPRSEEPAGMCGRCGDPNGPCGAW